METQKKIITSILDNNTPKMQQISPSQMSSKVILQSKENQNNIILLKADKNNQFIRLQDTHPSPQF